MEEHEAMHLTAPQVDYYRNCLGGSGHEARMCAPETIAKLPALLAEMRKISPYYDNGMRVLHFCVDRGTIEDFGDYEDMLSCGEVGSREEFEKYWLDSYPNEKQWFTFSFFEEDGYISISVNHRSIIAVRQDSEPEPWGIDAGEFVEWMTFELKNCVREIGDGTYNERIRRELPPELRIGTITRKAFWEVYPEEKAGYFENLPESDVTEFLHLLEEVEDMIPPKNRLKEMTSGLFYHACALGYAANKYEGCYTLSPKELYLKYADGRDDGLRELPEDSAEDFARWYEYERNRGGHPWEVCRGGNSTHVSLFVSHSDQGFYFIVDGKSWDRSVEAIKFYLSIHRAGLPVVIHEGKKLAERLTGAEMIGIVPDGVFPRYCDSYFPEESILDFMNLPHEKRDDLASRCVWKPEPELRIL